MSQDLWVHLLVTRLLGNLPVLHHEKDFDKSSDTSSGFGVANVALDRPEVEGTSSGRSTESVTNTPVFNRITDTST
jgi:hypothetical protein